MGMRFSFARAIIAAAAIALVGCGEAPPAPPPDQRVEAWNPLTEGVDIGDQIITAGPNAGYQAEYEVNMQGLGHLSLTYDITVEGGPGYFGVLTGDSSRWLANNTLEANAENQGEINLDVSDDYVRLVLQTSDQSTVDTRFTINEIKYRVE